MDNRKFYLFIQIGFVVSLILNGFALGFVVSSSGQRPFGPPPGPPPSPSDHLYGAAKQLSPESQARIKAILDEKTASIEKNRDKGGDDFEALRTILTAPEMDMEALNALVRKMGERHIGMTEKLSDMFTTLVEALPDDEERRTFFTAALPDRPMMPPPPREGRAEGPDQFDRKGPPPQDKHHH